MKLRYWRQFRDVEPGSWTRNRAIQNASRKRLLCSRDGCENQGRLFIEGRWGRQRFCVHHHRLQLEHERLVQKIRDIL